MCASGKSKCQNLVSLLTMIEREYILQLYDQNLTKLSSHFLINIFLLLCDNSDLTSTSKLSNFALESTMSNSTVQLNPSPINYHYFDSCDITMNIFFQYHVTSVIFVTTVKIFQEKLNESKYSRDVFCNIKFSLIQSRFTILSKAQNKN